MNTKTLIAAAEDGNLGSFKAPSNAYTLEIGEGTGEAAASNFEGILSVAVGGFTLVAVVYFLFVFLTAAFSWMSAGGDASKVQKARDSMTNGLIGLVILVAAYSIIGVVGTMLGIDILNPGSLLLDLSPNSAPVITEPPAAIPINP
ncbi:MAG: hypothetical protein HN846_03375 [Candidatus Pacebacteria bacterium]|jgi:hypothetical protein|nr:hypothetical protein [Candidatus Paceibacterota bacterium]MBT3512142.1 hypothetical protein [Candidatus Paceibacterota bacterium]MBT4005396.1 hypothetical protein [Candidatus Paceibacterota bacterium]MBT4359105.1 hypothetical protein [Candidatus Paceibacterota bacterium]MBT4680978.1 hypothetical protein [Candidatus Paceibacterota bacterium]